MREDLRDCSKPSVSSLSVRVAIGALLVALGAMPAGAQTFSSGSTGADGAFSPACTPTPCTVSQPLPASGTLNFSTVNVPAGVTVTFTRNATNTPVTILASGDVTIDGTIDVSGHGAGVLGIPGRGGPGGFDGGEGGNIIINANGTSGLGPGGGSGGVVSSNFGQGAPGGGGGFGSVGATATFGIAGGPTYGVRGLLPLIGGSGGGGGGTGISTPGGGGGGGGGAILVASSGTITISGIIVAAGGSGGDGFCSGNLSAPGGSGSGGAIRLVANRIAGSGALQTPGGPSNGSCNTAGAGGGGRIRLEAVDLAFVGSATPFGPTVALPRAITPPAGFPSVTITSLGAIAPPVNPQGNFLAPPDVVLGPSATNPVTVSLSASNIPTGTIVTVSVIPEGGNRTLFSSSPLSGTDASSTATASVTLPNGTSVISATATFATTVASNGAPMMIGGEEVKFIRVGATYGRGSTVAYITASGREVVVR